ncbi:MAG TPA: response regulator transcription factor [Solirubrobacterales bacterium]|nr:response regulator transcription factor [Solirubrobacterales bacterium]
MNSATQHAPERGSRQTRAFVLVDDDGLRARLGDALREEYIEVAELVADPEALAERRLGEESVLVAACDLDAPREVTALRRLRRVAPEVGIVVVSPRTTGTATRRAIDAGADGIVFEAEIERTVAVAVRGVAVGHSVVPRSVRAGLGRPTLSHRESEVLALLRKGLTNAEIAEHLFLAESTIKSHIASIFHKLGVHSRKEVAAALADIDGAPAPWAEAPESPVVA